MEIIATERWIKNISPDSPENIESFAMHSDDLQPTSDLHSSFLQGPSARLVVVGNYEKRVILGRGGASTIKIGRRNRQISRTHVSIEFNQEARHFQLTILGLNGASVDHVLYNQHAIVVLEDHSFIDVLGDHVEFRIPPLSNDTKKNSLQDFLEENASSKHIVKDAEAVKEDDIKPVNNEPNDSIHQTLSPDKNISVTVNKSTAEKPSTELMSIELKDKFADKFIKEPKENNKTKKEELKEEPKKEEPKEEPKEKLELESREDDIYDNNDYISNNEDDKLSEMEEPDYSEVIIDALVFSRTSSMPVSDICSRIMKSNPSYAEQSRELWVERIREVLKEKPFFGEIQRKGKTADGSPKENLYYYNSELDPVEWRKSTYTQVGRSARKCTLKDKQYFWKIPPKLGRHRSSYVPPPATLSESKKRLRQDQIENEDPKKTKL